ncbi:hypothetical protein HY479_01620 [Candidatus Uhrbacteria bacterium]|nr:hypothetical protein [Candidatus Uhrbacteria bacterium]
MLNIPKKNAHPFASRPIWLERATDDFRLFAMHISESRNIDLIDRFAIVSRRLVSFLEEPSPVRSQSLRDAISLLDDVRRRSGMQGELPVALWTIMRASHQDVVRTAAEALEQVARERVYVRMSAQA